MNKSSATFSALFRAFFRLGLTAFGGPAMVAYIRQLAVREKGWLSDNSFKQGISLCQTIPGATAMQAAAYAGLRGGRPWGAVAAYLGFGLPAFILMVVLSAAYTRTHDLPAVISLFNGLQVIVVAMVANATLNFGRRYIRIPQDVFLGCLTAGFLALGGSPIIAIAVSAALGLLLYRQLHCQQENAAVSLDPVSHWRMVRPALLLCLFAIIALLLLYLLDDELFSLAFLMVKIDFFAFGGGYASVPLMLHEIVEVQHWMSSTVLMDGIALGQITPGPIVITATFAGYLLAGIPGAVVGTISIFTPSLFLLLLVVPYFDRLQHNPVLQRALHGILVSFVGLLLAVTLRFGVALDWNFLSFLVAGCAFTALRLKVDILWVVIVGAGVSAFIL